MSRWWRAEDTSIDHPKLLRLSDAMHRAWYTLMCVASANDGLLPPTSDIALRLRIKPGKVAEWITTLVAAGLFDEIDGIFRPHNWDKRQYKSDVTDPTAPDRMKRYRERKRNERNATVTQIRPETETETETETEQSSADAAPAKSDRRKPKIQMPDIFPLSAKNIEYATSKGISGDRVEPLFGKFKNYHQSKGSVFASWDAAWRTWVDNENKFKPASSDDDVYRGVL